MKIFISKKNGPSDLRQIWRRHGTRLDLGRSSASERGMTSRMVGYQYIYIIKNRGSDFRAPPMFDEVARPRPIDTQEHALPPSYWKTGKLYLCNPPMTRKQGDFSFL